MNGTTMTAIPTSSEAGALVLSPTMLPRSENIEFRESSFFSRHSALPSPNEVRNRARLDEGLPTRTTKTGGRRRNVVLFPDVGLVVKWGSNISVGEGQCLGLADTYFLVLCLYLRYSGGIQIERLERMKCSSTWNMYKVLR